MNVEEIRAKLKAATQGKPKKLIWKPTDEHTVRSLPLPGEADITEVILWHYGVDEGRKMYCPQTDGEACPFCDLAQSLRSWKDANGNDKTEADRKRDWEFFKKIQAATKYYMPIAVRKSGGDPDDVEGAFWWEMTPKVREKLLTICANDDWNEDHQDGGGSRILTSLSQGLDLIVSLKKAGQKGNQTSYDLTEVEERKKFSALFKNKGKKAAEEFVANIPSLRDAVKVVTAAEAEKIFATWEASLTNEETKVDDKAGVEHGSNNAEQKLSGKVSADDVLARLDALIPPNQG